MPDREYIGGLDVEPLLLEAARNVIDSCLRVTNADRVTLLCDEQTLDVAAALVKALELSSASYSLFVLERRATRPATHLPPEILQSVELSTATIYTPHGMREEYPHRREFVKMAEKVGGRHAHLVGLTRQTLLSGMAADYGKIQQINSLLISKLSAETKIRLQSTAGTDLTATYDPVYPAVSVGGPIEPGMWQNLPSGEIAMHPKDTEGVYVCDGFLPLGESFDQAELLKKPLKLFIEDNCLIRLEGGANLQRQRIENIVSEGHNMHRLGMLCIGTNYGLKLWTGALLPDMYWPGAYLVLGETLQIIQLPWSSSGHIHFGARALSVSINDEPIISAGMFVNDIMDRIR